MDAFQHPHRFLRPPQPPPPHDADFQHQLTRPPPPNWYPGQFQYQSSQPPPPLPPHPQHQTPWISHSDHQSISSASYPTPHQNPIPPYTTLTHHNQYPPPPHPHMPPPPPPLTHPLPHHSHYGSHQIPQPYTQPNQTWGNSNWTHHQDTSVPNNNEEEWAARAREWAASNAALENQHLQSQLTPVGGQEEQKHVYYDQYQQAADSHGPDFPQPSLPPLSHRHFPLSTTDLHRAPINQQHASPAFSSGPSSYISDGHASHSHTARDGALAANSESVFSHQRSASTSSSISKQEVPYSYSSFPGKEEDVYRYEQLQKPSPLSLPSSQEGLHHVQPALPSISRSTSTEHSHFAYGDRSAESMVDPMDLPLDFAPKFTRDHDPHPQTGYTHSDPSWTPSGAPGVFYPPIPQVPSGSQFDPSFSALSPVPGHAASIFGRVPGQNFRPPIPAGAPFGLGIGTGVHPSASFPADINGIFNVSERPKKASVPNWLREEIIKKKSGITSSVQEPSEEEDIFQPIGDKAIDKSSRKSDQADRKSIDSSRSTEDEDDDEDDVEATRTASINQEIKRILTEVLLKVTDDLFDEIATKVLSEDDPTVEVENSTATPNTPNKKLSPSPPAVPISKASAEVLIPVKAREIGTNDGSRESSSGAPGDVLGLGSYASDDDDEEIQTSRMPSSRRADATLLQSSNGKLSEDIPVAVENGSLLLENEGQNKVQKEMESDNKTSPAGASFNRNAVNNELRNTRIDKKMETDGSSHKGVSVIQEDKIDVDGEKAVEGSDAFHMKGTVREKTYTKPKLSHGNLNTEDVRTDKFEGGEAQNKSDKKDVKRRSTSKDLVRDSETSKIKADEKHSDLNDSRRREERHGKKEKEDERRSKDRVKDQGIKPREKVKESDSRRGSARVNSKDDRKETEKIRRTSAKEDSNRKRERPRDVKGDKSSYRDARDSSRHKRRRSSSAGSRGQNSKDNSVGSHASDTSDEASEDARQRKTSSKRRSLSPSPTRSRRRQVSRSPHSKHSQRKKSSPYSSLESTRGRRSRSKSPIRRRR